MNTAAAAARVESLMLAMQKLTALYETERELIRVRDLAGLAPVVEEKVKYARLYEDAARALRIDRSWMEELTEEDRRQLREAGSAFAEASSANEAVLQSRVAAGETCLSLLVQSINRAREMDETTGLPRARYGYGRSAGSHAFNQVL